MDDLPQSTCDNRDPCGLPRGPHPNSASPNQDVSVQAPTVAGGGPTGAGDPKGAGDVIGGPTEAEATPPDAVAPIVVLCGAAAPPRTSPSRPECPGGQRDCVCTAANRRTNGRLGSHFKALHLAAALGVERHDVVFPVAAAAWAWRHGHDASCGGVGWQLRFGAALHVDATLVASSCVRHGAAGYSARVCAARRASNRSPGLATRLPKRFAGLLACRLLRHSIWLKAVLSRPFLFPMTTGLQVSSALARNSKSVGLCAIVRLIAQLVC